MLGIHYWSFALQAWKFETPENNLFQIYFYLLGTNYFRKSSDPRLCNETPRCPHLV